MNTDMSELNDYKRELVRLKIRNIMIFYKKRKQERPNSYDDIIADDVFATMNEDEKCIIVQKLNETR